MTVMKTSLTVLTLLCCTSVTWAQEYPEPEFAYEIYFLRKSDTTSVFRLEKGYSSLDTKVSVGGIGGAESAYQIEGDKSNIRIKDGKGLSFVYSTGASSAMYSSGFEAYDPSTMITLYKSDLAKGNRKIYLQKGGGYFSTKLKSSQKYSFSVKKIRNGYWELVIDKTLPKGEYVFTTMSVGMGSVDGSMSLFAFGIDE